MPERELLIASQFNTNQIENKNATKKANIKQQKLKKTPTENKYKNKCKKNKKM